MRDRCVSAQQRYFGMQRRAGPACTRRETALLWAGCSRPVLVCVRFHSCRRCRGSQSRQPRGITVPSLYKEVRKLGFRSQTGKNLSESAFFMILFIYFVLRAPWSQEPPGARDHCPFTLLRRNERAGSVTDGDKCSLLAIVYQPSGARPAGSMSLHYIKGSENPGSGQKL